jgi:RNA polymerase sigma-70 factor (ECF subfamily)
LRKREAFGPWIFRIARNEIAGHYRRRRQTLSLELVDEQSSSEPTPPEVVLRREQLARLTSALATLSEREQEIIRLKFGAGLRNQEIAKVMRLRAGHVAVILYRALRKLRGQLDAD